MLDQVLLIVSAQPAHIGHEIVMLNRKLPNTEAEQAARAGGKVGGFLSKSAVARLMLQT